MKKFLFILSGIFASIGVVIALQNAAVYDCTYQVLFDQITGSLPKPIFVIFLIGFLSGLPLGMGFMVRKAKREDVQSLEF